MTDTIAKKYVDPYADSLARFNRECGNHEMTVLHDDGLYRHLRFNTPAHSLYWFDLVTWPGYLTISGDFGCYTFARIGDMFEFFLLTGDSINPSYWAEKVKAGDLRGYSDDSFTKHVTEHFEQYATRTSLDDTDRKALWDEVTEEVLGCSDYEVNARDAIRHFRSDNDRFSDFDFEDAEGWEFEEFRWEFLLCCQAVIWGIGQYRKQPRAAQVTALIETTAVVVTA